ncbi:hypothetical protein PENTCL1PPCAC_24697, partial [Pristionchus entomophagus]
MEHYDLIFGIFWYFTGACSLIINCFFLFLIIFKSPSSLTPYKILLGNSAVTDLVFSMSTTFLQCRIIPNKWAFAYVALGPAKYFGEQVSYYSYVIQLHSLFYLFLCFPLSFGFRYYILIRPMPTMRQLSLLLFSIWLLPLGQLICFVNSQSNSTAIREYLKENKPEYDLTGYVVTGNHMVWQPLTPITLASIVLPMFPIYCLIIFFSRRVNEFLDRRDSGLALMIQAALPLLFVFPPITVYLLYHLELIHFTIMEYLVYSIFSIMPMVSPVVSIYFVRPYYLWIMLRRNQLLGLPPPEGSTNVGNNKS